jgi:hypothetical protein
MAYIKILSGLSEKLNADNSDWTPNSVNAMRTAWGSLFALEFSNRHKRPTETNYTEDLVEAINNKKVLQTLEALTILHLTMCDVFDPLNRFRNISTYKDSYEEIKKEARKIWEGKDFKNKASIGRKEKRVYNPHGQEITKMSNTVGIISDLEGMPTIALNNIDSINQFLTSIYHIIASAIIIINALLKTRVIEKKGAWLEQYDAIHEKDEELEDYLLINERVNTIYDYIKKISKNNIYPLFDKISYSSLLEFLYSSVEIDDKFLF